MNKLFRSSALFSSIAAGWCVLLASPTWAVAPSPHVRVNGALPPSASSVAPLSIGTLNLDSGKGTLLKLNEDAASVFVVDPSIADVHVPAPRDVFVLGKKPGSTTLYVLGANNKTLVQRTIMVARDMDALRAEVAARFPDLHLDLSAGDGSLSVAGAVPDSSVAQDVVQTLTASLMPKEVLVNRMTISRPLQVQLQVRITEVDRNVTQELGINWSTLGKVAGNFVGGIGSGRTIVDSTTGLINLASNNAFSILGSYTSGSRSITALVDALNQENLLTVLAEPNLVALSGQTASFLAGGEFPIPTAQTNGAVTVTFKQFGVKLDFTPTVMSGNRISLKVRPEVSSIDTSVSVTTSGITIPGLSVRRADTTVELSSGQSFAIGGLLQSNFPGLGRCRYLANSSRLKTISITKPNWSFW
jgi:pilus assembly protein CpaC